MKNRGKSIGLVLAGVLIGTAISGPAAYAAEEWYKAYRSGRNFYVNGEQVEMDAYTVEGNNYVKLRDVGRLVGFNVWWDEENCTVQIETGSPYTGEAPEKAEPDVAENPTTTEDTNPAVLTGKYTREAYEAPAPDRRHGQGVHSGRHERGDPRGDAGRLRRHRRLSGIPHENGRGRQDLLLRKAFRQL